MPGFGSDEIQAMLNGVMGGQALMGNMPDASNPMGAPPGPEPDPAAAYFQQALECLNKLSAFLGKMGQGGMEAAHTVAKAAVMVQGAETTRMRERQRRAAEPM